MVVDGMPFVELDERRGGSDAGGAMKGKREKEERKEKDLREFLPRKATNTDKLDSHKALDTLRLDPSR